MSGEVRFYHLLPSSPVSSEKSASTASLKGRMVKVVTQSPLDDDKIMAELKNVGQQLISDERKTLPEIVIQQEDGGLKLRLGDQPLSSPAPSNTAEMPLVRKMDTSFKSSKSWLNSFKKDIQKLHPKGNISLGFFITCEVLLFPLTLLGYSLYSVAHAIATSREETRQKEVAKQEASLLSGPGTFSSFLATMGVMDRVLKQIGCEENITDPFSRTLSYGRKIEQYCAGTTSEDSLIDQIKSDIEKGPVIIPTGSYAGDVFVPALLYIEKLTTSNPDKEASYRIKRLSLDPSSTTQKAQVLHCYGILKDNFSRQLKDILDTQKNGPSLTDSEHKKLLLTEELSHLSIGPHEKREVRSGLDILFTRWTDDNLIQEESLTEEEKPWAFASPSTDPLSLIMRMSHLTPTPPKKALAEQKADFLHLFVSELIKQYTKISEELSPDKRLQLNSALQNRIEKLQRRLSKCYGEQIATDYITNLQSALSKQAIRSTANEARTLIEKRDQLLQYPPHVKAPSLRVQPQALAVPGKAQELEQKKRGQTSSIDISAITMKCNDLQSLFMEDIAIEAAQLQESFEIIDTLTTKANELIKNKHYEEARVILENILAAYPAAQMITLLESIPNKEIETLLQKALLIEKGLFICRLGEKSLAISSKQIISTASVACLASYYRNRRALEALKKCFPPPPKESGSELDRAIKNYYDNQAAASINDKINLLNDVKQKFILELKNTPLEQLLIAHNQLTDEDRFFLYILQRNPIDPAIETIVLNNPLLQHNKDLGAILADKFEGIRQTMTGVAEDKGSFSFFLSEPENDRLLGDRSNDSLPKMLSLMQEEEVLHRAILAPEFYFQTQIAHEGEQPSPLRSDKIFDVEKKTKEILSLEAPEKIEDLKLPNPSGASTNSIIIGNVQLSYQPDGIKKLPLNFYNTIALAGQSHYPLLRLKEGHPKNVTDITTLEKEAHTLPFYYKHAQENPLSTLEPAIEAQALCLDKNNYTSVNSAISLMLDHPELLSNPVIQLKIRQALTSNTYLTDSILLTSQSWSSYLPMLQKVYDKLCEAKDAKAILFMAEVIEQINTHLSITKKSIDILLKSSLRSDWAAPGSLSNYKLSLISIYQGKEGLEKVKAQIDELSALSIKWTDQLDTIIKDIESSKDPITISLLIQKALLLLSKEDIKNCTEGQITSLLYAWGIATKTVSSKQGWDDFFLAKEKMMLELLPLFKEQIETHPDILTNLFTKQTQIPLAKTISWAPVEGSYLFTANDGQYQIDLQQGTARDIYASEKTELTPLPFKTLKDPHYLQVFGAEEHSGTLNIKEGQRIFEIEDAGITFMVEIGSNSEVIKIQKKEEGKTYTHVRGLLTDDTSSLGQLIKKEGLWKDDTKDEYHIILHSLDGAKKERVSLEFNKEKKLISAKTSDGKVVSTAPQKAMAKAFDITDPSGKIFLSTEKDGPITDILFIDSGLRLQKNTEGTFESSEKQGWAVDDKVLLRLSALHGTEIQQVLIPFSKGAEVEYKIFLRPLLPSSYKEKERHIAIDTKAPARQVSISIDSQSRMKGVHSAFLYMARYCLAKGNLSEAALYLKGLCSENASAPQQLPDRQRELAEILLMEQALCSFVPRSDAEAAFLLKAQLSIDTIKRQTYGYKENITKVDEVRIQREKRLCDLFTRYNDAINVPDKKEALRAKHLLLSDAEQQEASHWVDKTKAILEGITAQTPQPLLATPNHVSDNFLIHLVSLAAPVKDIEASWPGEDSLSKDLLQNFFSYVEHIKKSANGVDLHLLQQEIDPSLDPALKQAIDEARCYLLLMEKAKVYPSIPALKDFPDIDTISQKTEPSAKQQKGIKTYIDKVQQSLNTFIVDAGSKFKEPRLSSTVSNEAEELAETIDQIKKRLSPILKDAAQTSIDNLETRAKERLPLAYKDIANPIGSFTIGQEVRTPFMIGDEGVSAQEQVDISQNAALELFQGDKKDSAIQNRELERIRDGITMAAEDRKKAIEAQHHRVVDPNQLDDLKDRIQNEKKDAFHKRSVFLHNITTQALAHSQQLGISSVTKKGGLATKGEVILPLLSLYEEGNIETTLIQNGMDQKQSAEVARKLEADITAFLILSTKLHLLDKALSDPIGSITQLKELKALGSTKDSAEWSAACSELNKKIDRGCDLTFFFDDEGLLKDPFLSRPALVFSYKNQIGITQEQMVILKKILDEPNALEELRMGLGKSFVIAPLVAKILVNKGIMPTILFTEELLNLSKKDMDPRAYEFSFQRNPPLSAEELAEEYKTLLKVKQSGRYIISSISRFAALENKYHELMGSIIEQSEAIKSLNKKLQSPDLDDKGRENLQARLTIQKATSQELCQQLHWIKKIYNFFDPTTFNSRFIVDEVDAILHISSEINYAEGVSKNIDPSVEIIGRSIFEKILSAEEAPLLELMMSIQSNTQATLAKETLSKAIESLASALCNDPKILSEMGLNDLNDSQKKELAAYLCGKKDTAGAAALRPAFLGQWDDADGKKYISILKHWLCTTLPIICSKTYGINFGLATDRVTVVPMEGGRAKTNTMFAEEYELSGYHLLSYIQQGCTNEDFFLRTLKQIKVKAEQSDQWRDWLSKIGYDANLSLEEQNQKLLQNLGRQDKALLRVQFLDFMLLHTSTVQMFKKQIPLLVQNIIAERDAAGISGSMNAKALPSSFSKKEKEPRAVAGDLLLRLQGQEGGLSAIVDTFTDPMAKMAEICRDTKYKALINIGAPFIGKSTRDVINELRGSNPSRQFIYIDSESKLPFIWLAGKGAPQLFDKDKDAKLVDQTNCLFYFSPADTRGTDFKIPSGCGAVIPGSATTLSELEQAVWRLRKLGAGHTAEFFLSDAIAKRIKAHTSKDDVTVADLFHDVLEQTIDDDKMANFKRKAVDPSSIVKKHVKLSLLRSDSPLELNDDGLIRYLDEESKTYKSVQQLFRREQTLDLKTDFEVDREIESLRFLEQLYDSEITNVKDLTEKLGSYSPRPTFLIQALQAAKEELEQAKSELAQIRLDSIIDEKVKASISLDAGAQSQVEQQQQQMTTLQSTVALKQSGEDVSDVDLPQDDPLDTLDPFAMSLETIQYCQDNLDGIGLSLLHQLFGYSTQDPIYISKMAATMLENDGAHGRLQVHAVTSSSGYFVLVTDGEMEGHLNAAIDKSKQYKIYSLSLSDSPPIPIIDDSPAVIDSKFTQKMIIAKALFGGTITIDEEKDALKQWFTTISVEDRNKIIASLRDKGGIDGADLLKSWINEPKPKGEQITKTHVTSAIPKTLQGASTPQRLYTEASSYRLKQSPAQGEGSAEPEDALPEALTPRVDAVSDSYAKQKIEYIRSQVTGLGILKTKAIELLLGLSVTDVLTSLTDANFSDEEMQNLEKWIFTQPELKTITLSTIGQAKKFIDKYKKHLQSPKQLRDFYNNTIAPPRRFAKVKTAEIPPAQEAPLPSAQPQETSLTKPNHFILDKGGKGNCATLALYDQMNQREITGHTSHRLLREAAREYIEKRLNTFSNPSEGSDEEEIYGLIENSLRDSAAILSKKENKAEACKENLQAYANLIAEDGQWLDKGFFAVMAKVLDKQIVILRKDNEGKLTLEERFPTQPIERESSLFLFYNGKTSGGGDHFQSIDLEQKDVLQSLINRDIEKKVDEFIQTISASKANQASIYHALEDLLRCSPQAYEYITDTVPQHDLQAYRRLQKATIMEHALQTIKPEGELYYTPPSSPSTSRRSSVSGPLEATPPAPKKEKGLFSTIRDWFGWQK